MAIDTILSLVPASWRVVIALGVVIGLGGAFGFGMWKGYGAGFDAAKAEGEAALSDLMAAHDRAYADAMQAMNERIRRQTDAAMAASAELAGERERNAREKASLVRRIEALTADSGHRFSPAFVELWNEAAGADCGYAGGTVADPAGTAGVSGNGAASGAGVPTGSVKDTGVPTGSVSEADVLNYMAYFGARCRDMDAQLSALITLIKDSNDID